MTQLVNLMTNQNSNPARWSRDLNTQQMEAVTAPPGQVLVVAGPGSGKTRVVTCRILHLVEEMRVHPSRILAMTFTNKAAGEMKRRLRDFLGEEDVGRLWTGTFHATCARLLRIHHAEADVPKDFTIIDEDDQLRILASILKEHFPGRGSLKPPAIRHRIEKAKRSSVTPEAYEARDKEGEATGAVYALYEAWLRDHRALDFGDLILRTVRMLERSAAPREALAERFMHVLVDEFQDTDLLQYKFVRILSGKHGNLFVVGDDDQSIYRWRGARVENMLSFRQDYPGCRVVKLEKNYRSTSRILDAAMAVIGGNRERTCKTLWTDGPEGVPVRLLEYATESDEARAIAREIGGFVKSGGRYGGCAVIYRIHAQSRAIEEALIESKVPYRIVGGVRFYERMEIKDLVSYLKLAFSPGDDVSLTRVLNVPPRGLGEETLRVLQQAASARGASLHAAIRVAAEERLLPARRLEELKKLGDLLARLAELAGELPPSGLLEEVIRATSYEEHLRRGFPESCETRLENVRELRGFLAKLEEEESGASLAQLFDRIALQTTADAIDMKEDRVTLMTAHSAKGLEFDSVCVAGVEKGLFPYEPWNVYQMDEHERKREIEEDCRLLYVAMTRARQRLLLTWAMSRRLFSAREKYQCESPFLLAVPQEIIRRTDLPRGKGGAAGERGAAAGHSLPTKPHDDGSIRVGDAVKHSKFGPGTVVDVKPGRVKKITVKFRRGMIKQIVETFLERN
jgi:DNA helicase-2/ATP-dependent DNA helicase PcrA